MRKRNWIRGVLSLMLVLCMSFQLSAQITLGKMTMPQMEAPPLQSPTDMHRGSVYSQSSLSGVGGIAFELEALPPDSLSVHLVRCSYNSQNQDGNRLVVVINGQRIDTKIYDWQLIPIAMYAESPYYACFTYFGSLKDKIEEKRIMDEGGHIMNYHSAFENTLLGLRLMQMDLMLMYDDCADLPKKNNVYILGKGESQPNVFANLDAMSRVVLKLKNVEAELQVQFRSYLISDYQQNIRFFIKNDTLQITGYPFYYCWKYVFDTMSQDEQSQFNQKVVADIDEEIEKINSQSEGYFDERKWYIDKLLAELKRYQGSYALYAAGTTVNMAIEQSGDEARRNFLDQYYTSSLRQMLIELRYEMEMYRPVFLEEYSKRLSDEPDVLRDMNPPVWDASVNTMRYAAFFRYCKSHYPNEWQAFLEQINDIDVKPVAETPTVLRP
ncbi:hypothetical protein JW835_06990 [bacterium]|nr:hypothetical protein [bacterium]